MSLAALTQTIQYILAPVVMVTACAIMVNGFLSLYGDLNTRMRALTHERLELLRQSDGTLGVAPTESDGTYISERIAEIDAQLPILLRRHEMTHRGALAIYVAILAFVLSMLALAWTALTRSSHVAALALIVFLAGAAIMLVGVLMVSIEVAFSNTSIKYEVRRVLDLGRR